MNVEAKADKDSVKVGFEIGREELVRQMAELALNQMFTKRYPGSFEEGPGYDYVDISKLQEKVESVVLETVQERVQALVEEVTIERVRAEMEKIFVEGWSKTDTYGNQIGKVTLRDFALGMLTKVDSYNRKSIMEVQADKLVDEALTKALKPEIDALKAKAKAALNSGFEKAIREALAKGVGLGG